MLYVVRFILYYDHFEIWNIIYNYDLSEIWDINHQLRPQLDIRYYLRLKEILDIISDYYLGEIFSNIWYSHICDNPGVHSNVRFSLVTKLHTIWGRLRSWWCKTYVHMSDTDIDIEKYQTLPVAFSADFFQADHLSKIPDKKYLIWKLSQIQNIAERRKHEVVHGRHSKDCSRGWSIRSK